MSTNNAKFGTATEAGDRRRNKKPSNYRQALLKVDGRAMTLEEVEAAVGVEVSLTKLRALGGKRPLTLERIRNAYLVSSD
jgi:hypothetical protein